MRIAAVSTGVLLALVLAASACTSTNDQPAEPATSSAPSTPLRSTTTTATAAATTTTSTPHSLGTPDTDWDTTPLWEADLAAPGHYRTELFVAPFRFTMPAGWWSIGGDRSDWIGLGPPGGEDGLNTVSILSARADTVEQAYDHVAALPELEVTAPGPTEVGAAQGIRYQATATGPTTLFTLDDGTNWFFDAERTNTLITVDVNGTIVTIIIEALDELYSEFEPAALNFIDTIQWKPAP